MNKTIENTVDVEVHEDDIITLGVASIDTKGNPGEGEGDGMLPTIGIAED